MYNVKKVLTVVSGLIFLFFVHGNALAQMREGSHEFGGKGFSQGGFSHGGTAFSHHETTRPSNNTARPSNNVVSNNMAFNHNTTFSDSRSSNRDFDRDGDRDFRRRSHNRSFITFFGYDPFYYNPYGYPYYYSYEAAPTYNSTSVPVTEIADMASRGIPDDVIIDTIKNTGSVYYLTSEVIAYLKQHNVSDRVIDFMLATGSGDEYPSSY